ncbi:MAG: aldose epimerase family protein [Sedimentisphaerales bacterium]|jgi:aldose 1-epimerase|nr:aldose epimerase family protein [Sedimentisphaerales bacterium]
MGKVFWARLWIMSVLVAGMCSCQMYKESFKKEGKVGMDIKKSVFGKTPDGRQVDLYTLTNSKGIEARIMTFGGTVVSLKVPDRNGNLGDIVLGHDSLEPYLLPDHKGSPYFGCIIGRYGNRIGKARFTLDGKIYALATNDGPNHLHGGREGFDRKIWNARPIRGKDYVALELSYTSPDMEEGYPGNLKVKVTYTLTEQDELRIDYEATTDKPTICNLTNHNYYNLTCGKGDILDHELMIVADYFTPVDEGLIPTGEFRPVEGTPMDFRTPKPIGRDINADYDQRRFGRGYDHNWVLRRQGQGLSLAARLYEPTSGRVMEIYTTEPGIQFYSGNFLDGSITGKGGTVYKHRWGLCLETQHYPDSPNKPDWPSTVLRPGQVYRTTTVHRFSTR